MHLYGYATIRLMPYLKTDLNTLLPKTEELWTGYIDSVNINYDLPHIWATI